MGRECRWPGKRAYESRAAACAAHLMVRARGQGEALKPYPCAGHWHLGNRRQRLRLDDARIPPRPVGRGRKKW